MAQTIVVISLCLLGLLIVSVLAEEQLQTNEGNNIEENGSNKPPENIDRKIIEERCFGISCPRIFSKLTHVSKAKTAENSETPFVRIRETGKTETNKEIGRRTTGSFRISSGNIEGQRKVPTRLNLETETQDQLHHPPKGHPLSAEKVGLPPVPPKLPLDDTKPNQGSTYQLIPVQKNDGEKHNQLRQININTGESIPSNANLKFFNYDKFSMESYTIHDTGTSIYITVQYSTEDLDKTPHISGETPTDDFLKYRLEQVHFHRPSRYAINDETYPLEVEFIHNRFEEKSPSHGPKLESHIPSVYSVSVQFTQSEKKNENLDELLSMIWKATEMPEAGKMTVTGSINLHEWLPIKEPVFYYWYRGTLMMGSSTEKVVRFILKTPNTLTAKQLRTFDIIKKETTGKQPYTLANSVFHNTGDGRRELGLTKNKAPRTEEEMEMLRLLKKFESK